MNRSSLIICTALLALVFGPGACSTAGGSNGTLISDSYAETGMLNPVVVVGERSGFVLSDVAVTAPVLRLEIEGTAARLIVPGLVRIEFSFFRPSADSANRQGRQMANLRWAGDRRMLRHSQRLGTEGIRPTEE